MNNQNRDMIERYINNVRHELYGLTKAESCINEIRSNLEEYVKQFPDCDYEDLVKQFGHPRDVAKDIIEEENPLNPKKRAMQRKRHRAFVVAMLGILVVLIIFVAALSGNRQAYFSDETRVIEEWEE